MYHIPNPITSNAPNRNTAMSIYNNLLTVSGLYTNAWNIKSIDYNIDTYVYICTWI